MVHTIPFGYAVRLWRFHRQLTQAELARRARIPRPNLSAIEQGRREASLGTLRALAAGLDIRPGLLVDGMSPATADVPAPALSRSALERLAEAVTGQATVGTEQERAMVEALRQITRHRAAASGMLTGRLRRGRRAAQAAWLLLQATYPQETLRSLLQRIEDRQARS